MNVVAQAQGPLLLLGASGTGKTTLFVDAAAQRLREGRPPALVFAASRQAASEMRDRIVRACGQTMLAPRVLTIHAFCRELIGTFGHDDDATPELLTAPEQEFRIRELLAGWAGSWPQELADAVGTRAFAAQIRAVLARARQLGLDPEDVLAHGAAAREPGWGAVGAFMAEYLDVLDAEARLDYAELVHRARLLIEREDVRRAVLQGVGAVYVDEWCELDPAQISLLRALVPEGFPVVAAADPDTAIYRFRGAHPRAAEEFIRLFATPDKPPAIHVLTRAWRQSPAQVAALGSVRQRLGAPALHDSDVARRYRDTDAGGAGMVDVWTCPDEATQARVIAGELRAAHLEQGLAWGDMAVLVRAGRQQIPPLARELADAGIPVEVAGDEIGLAGELAVRPLLLALEIAGRGGVPDPDEAHRLLLSGWGGFDAVSIRRLGRRLRGAPAEGAGIPAEALIAEALGGLRDVPEGEETLALRRDLLAAAATTIRTGGRPEDALWTLWAGTDWPATLRQEALRGGDSAPRAHRDLDAVTALFTLARESLAPVGDEGVRWFLAEIAQQQIPADSQREAAVFGRGVRVLTAHRAKGHAWPFTIVAGVQEGIWPDIQRRGSVFDPLKLTSAGLGEGVSTRELVATERRLFLLACSRAQHRLLVTAVEGTDGEDDRPSRFLSELGRPLRTVDAPEPRLHTLRALVADLRRTAQDDAASPSLRQAATRRLAALAQQRDDSGTPLVPDADPRRWWGLAEPTSWAAPTPEDRLVLSPSQLEGILACPRQFFLRREARADPPRGSATVVGSVIHAVAERAATGELSAHSAEGLLDEIWADIPFAAAWLSASERADADAAVARFLAWQAGHEHADLVGVEVPFAVRIDIDGAVVTLRGSVDRLERTAGGDLRVIDFKTGRSTPTKDEVARMPQIGVYQLAIEAGAFDDVAPGAASAGASLVYLRHDDNEGWPKEFRQPSLTEAPHLTDDADELAYPTWVHQRVAQAHAVLASGRFDARPGPVCRHCPVASSCPARSGQVM